MGVEELGFPLEHEISAFSGTIRPLEPRKDGAAEVDGLR